MDPKFSVVMSVYNKAKYLERSIYSILGQSVSDFEVVCIDGGSTDGSCEYLESIVVKDSRVRLIKQVNQGFSVAKNAGIKEAKSDLIAFLDADDEWDKDYLQEILWLYQKYPNANAYLTGYRCITLGRSSITIYNNNNQSGYIDQYYKQRLRGWGVHTSSVVIRRSILEKTGLFPNIITSKSARYSWLVNGYGEIICTFPGFTATGRTVPFNKSISHLNENIQKYNDLEIELPGPPAEDQYVHDSIALIGIYAFSRKVLSTWYGNIPNQTTARIECSPFYPHLIAINTAVYKDVRNNNSNKYMIRYAQYLSIGIIDNINRLSQKDKISLYNIYKLSEIWGIKHMLFVKLKIIVWRIRNKFN